jgi:hypothetical protein
MRAKSKANKLKTGIKKAINVRRKLGVYKTPYLYDLKKLK